MPAALHLASGTVQTVSVNTTYYISAGQGPVTTIASGAGAEDKRKVWYETAGIATFLQAYLLNNGFDTIATIKSRKNLTQGGMQISIPKQTSGLFTDVNGSDSLASGDYFNYELSSGSGTGTMSLHNIGHMFNSNTTSETISKFVAGHNATFATSSTRYMVLAGSLSVTQGSQPAQQKQIDTDCTLKHLYVYVSSNSRTVDTTIKIKRGTDVLLSVTYGSGESQVKEVSGSVAVTAGELLNYELASTSSANFVVEVISAEFATTNDKFILCAGNSDSQSPDSTKTYYGSIAGRQTLTEFITNENAFFDARLNIAAIVSKLQIHISSTSTDGTSTLVLVKNGAETNIKVSIPSGTTGQLEDGSNPTLKVAATDTLKYKLTVGGSASHSLTVRGILLICEVDADPQGVHNLLSYTHPDTVPATVARGDIIIGQSTAPAWQRKALGAAGKFLKSDGLDLVYSADVPPVYNVKEDGAVGDGTGSQQTAINTTISRITSSGGILFFPYGNYQITAGLSSLPYDNIWVMFEKGAKITISGSQLDVFSATGKNNLKFTNVRIVAGNDKCKGIFLTNCTTIQIDDFDGTMVKGTDPNPSAGMHLADCNDIHVSRPKVKTASNGVRVMGTTHMEQEVSTSSVSMNNTITRVAEKVTANSILVNKEVGLVIVRLKKTSNPSSTTRIVAKVWNSSGEVFRFGEFDPANLPTSNAWIIFMAEQGQRHTLVSGQYIGVEYTSGGASDTVDVAASPTDAFDGSNSVLSKWDTTQGGGAGAWVDETKDVAMTLRYTCKDVWISEANVDDMSQIGIQVNGAYKGEITSPHVSNTPNNGIDTGFCGFVDTIDAMLQKTGVTMGKAFQGDRSYHCRLIDAKAEDSRPLNFLQSMYCEIVRPQARAGANSTGSLVDFIDSAKINLFCRLVDPKLDCNFKALDGVFISQNQIGFQLDGSIQIVNVVSGQQAVNMGSGQIQLKDRGYERQIYFDETERSGTVPASETTISGATYSLAQNSFRKIKATAYVELVNTATSDDQVVTVKLKIGTQSVTAELTSSSSPTVRRQATVVIERTQQSSATIEVTVTPGSQGSDANTTIKVKSLEVVGIE